MTVPSTVQVDERKWTAVSISSVTVPFVVHVYHAGAKEGEKSAD